MASAPLLSTPDGLVVTITWDDATLAVTDVSWENPSGKKSTITIGNKTVTIAASGSVRPPHGWAVVAVPGDAEEPASVEWNFPTRWSR